MYFIKSSFLSAFVLLTLTSCLNFSGKLDVEDTLTLYHEYRGRLYKRVLPPGDYQANFSIIDRMVGQLDVTTRDGVTLNTVISAPYDTFIPRDNGSFFISHYKTSQIYDISGDVYTTKITDSTVYYGIENCNVWDQRYVCHRECGPYGCRDICRWQRVRLPGDQNVEYRKSQVSRTVTINFLIPHSGRKQGSFSGINSRSEKEYLYRGQCRPYRY